MDNEEKIALKSGYYFMIFEKDKVPFFDELEKTNKVILKDNQKYHLYTAPTWEVAQKVDAFMGNDELGYDIDEFLLNKDIKI